MQKNNIKNYAKPCKIVCTIRTTFCTIMQRINQKNMILWRKGRKHCYITMEWSCLRKGSVNVIFHILMYSITSCTIFFLLSTTHIFYLMQWRCNLAGRCMLTLKKKTWLDYDSSKENEIRDCTVNVFRSFGLQLNPSLIHFNINVSKKRQKNWMVSKLWWNIRPIIIYSTP